MKRNCGAKWHDAGVRGNQDIIDYCVIRYALSECHPRLFPFRSRTTVPL
jgi:hypothetical protein